MKDEKKNKKNKPNMKLAVRLETISQYAKRYRISRQAAWKRIKKGKIKAVRIGSIWAIPLKNSNIKKSKGQ